MVLNLLTDSWLPVRHASGALSTIAIADLGTGSRDNDPPVALAAPRPDLNAALLEWLIGVVTVALAPEDDDGWIAGWEQPVAREKLVDALAPWSSAFNLDGDGPRAFQDLDPLNDAPLNHPLALFMDMPGAQTLRQNKDIFIKRTGPAVLSPATAAMALIALQTFAPSGGAGHRTSVRGGGPMTTFSVLDRDGGAGGLWDLVWANVLTRAQLRSLPGGDRPWTAANMFPWLAPTRTSDPKNDGVETAPENTHALQCFFGMPRRIRLEFEPADGRTCALGGMATGQVVTGFRMQNYGTNYTGAWLHPLTPHYSDGSAPPLPVHPQPGGIAWRDWLGLVFDNTDGKRTALAAKAVQVSRARSIDTGARLRLLVTGYDFDNMKARGFLWRELPVPLPGRDGATEQQVARAVREMVRSADHVAYLLRRTVRQALVGDDRERTVDTIPVSDRFWEETEPAFLAEVARLDVTPDGMAGRRQRWLGVLRGTALRLLEEEVSPDRVDLDGMHRLVVAWKALDDALAGRGKDGKTLCERLDLPLPARKSDAPLEEPA